MVEDLQKYHSTSEESLSLCTVNLFCPYVTLITFPYTDKKTDRERTGFLMGLNIAVPCLFCFTDLNRCSLKLDSGLKEVIPSSSPH